MGGKIHPALAFAKQVEGWSPGIFSKVDKWRETESPALWQFMTFRQCRAWISDWHRRNHTSSSSEIPCQKAHWQSYWKGKPTQGEEKSMLLKWKPPQIVNGKDDDSLEAVVRFLKETNKGDKE